MRNRTYKSKSKTVAVRVFSFDEPFKSAATYVMGKSRTVIFDYEVG